jgi:predicted site-specific integrase-resolvase
MLASEFATAIGVTKKTVCKWIREGRLPGCTQQSNGYYSIPSHYIEEYKSGELPLAPSNLRRREIVNYLGSSRHVAK